MATNFIKSADLKKGAFTAQAKSAGESVRSFAEKMKGAPGVTGKRARLALTFEEMAAKRKAVTGQLKRR